MQPPSCDFEECSLQLCKCFGAKSIEEIEESLFCCKMAFWIRNAAEKLSVHKIRGIRNAPFTGPHCHFLYNCVDEL